MTNIISLRYTHTEATSALDLENEKAMYNALDMLAITYVSVGHRPSLLRYHSKKLVLLGPGLPPKVLDVTTSEAAIEMMDLVGSSASSSSSSSSLDTTA